MHVSHTLLHELEVVGLHILVVAVELDGFQAGHSTQQSHQPVVVRLKLCLVKRWDPQHANLRAQHRDELVEKLKVERDQEMLQHLLEAELVEELPPFEVLLGVFLEEGRIRDSLMVVFAVDLAVEQLS